MPSHPMTRQPQPGERVFRCRAKPEVKSCIATLGLSGQGFFVLRLPWEQGAVGQTLSLRPFLSRVV